MDEQFLPFLLVVVLPAAYLGWRAGLFSTSALRVATCVLLAALALPRFPFDGVAYEFLKRLNLLVTAVTVGALVLRWIGARPLASPRTFRVVLVSTAFAAVLSYTNFFSFHGARQFVHLHDVAHYYLGSKYFSELGYGSLYTAMVRAEAEEYGYSVTPEVRKLDGNYLVPVGQVLEESGPVRARFSPERWQAFRADVRYFRDRMGNAWGGVLRDHGFNPTPVWALVGGALANVLPGGPAVAVPLLALLDPLLLAVAFLAIGRTFGLETACLAVIYFCTAFGAMFTWKGGSFLRELSFASIVLSACALERRRFALGGAALGFAAALRVFPALLAAGPLLGGAAEALRTRRIPRATARFLAGLVLAGAVLGAATVLRPDGVSAWREFSANISTHMQSASSNLIGVTGLLAYAGEPSVEEGSIDRLIERRRSIRRIQLATVFPAAVALVLLLSVRAPALESMALGAVLVLAGLNLSAYYYTFLVLLVLAFRDRPRELAFVFAVEMLVYLSHLFEQHEVMLFLHKSLLLSFLMVALWLEPARVAIRDLVRRRSTAPAAPAPAAAAPVEALRDRVRRA